MKKYKLSFGQHASGYDHPHPERTAYRTIGSNPMNGDLYFQVWSNRKALAKSIRMQQKRERRSGDWTPLVKLTDTEGY